ncbi:MAG: hypothetical protein COB46_09090 [Rhodospirillaceae bacterium]|nr:MAG: hypothetical protein COB46_09090 [Rhodospirillaceae bacterium]
MIRKTPAVLASLLLLIFSVQACAPVGLVLGAGAATGMAAYQERGVDGVARDLRTSSFIFELYARTNHLLLKDISVEVYEGRVLLVGQVTNEAMRAQAVRLAWTVDGTKDVINEIHVTNEGGFLDTARDAWITTQLEAKLTFDDKVLAINYAIETVGGIIYLMGIAQSQAELDRVKNQAKSISYVRHIISHVRVKTPQAAPLPAQAPAGNP